LLLRQIGAIGYYPADKAREIVAIRVALFTNLDIGNLGTTVRSSRPARCHQLAVDIERLATWTARTPSPAASRIEGSGDVVPLAVSNGLVRYHKGRTRTIVDVEDHLTGGVQTNRISNRSARLLNIKHLDNASIGC
jgi:hypothetical protein